MTTRLMEMLSQWRETDPRVGPALPGRDADPAAVSQARVAYEQMHGHAPDRILQTPVRCASQVTASLGPTVAIDYRDGGSVKRLEFQDERPELVFDEIDRSLHLVTGGQVLEPTKGGWFTSALPAGITPDQIERAKKEYRNTHGGRDPDKILWSEVPCARGPLVSLGPVVAVEYLADKGDGVYTYRHAFQSDPPLLAFDLRTKSLHLVLGSYTVTNHGVEDTMQPSDYAIVANPGPSRELGLHPHLRRPLRDNPDGEAAVGVGVMLLTLAVGTGTALLASWGVDKLAHWRGWSTKTGAWIKLGLFAVVGAGFYFGWPILGTGIIVAGVTLSAAQLLQEWKSTSPGAGLPAPAAAPQLPAANPVFKPYAVPSFAQAAS